MPVKTTDYDTFVRHLVDLGLRPGDDIFVQGRLTSFGRMEFGVEDIYRALRSIIGDDATIIVPTYRYSLRDQVFDRQTSPSQNCGVLSEYVRMLPGAIRSNCPMHSHAGMGPKAGMLDMSDGLMPFGDKSDFDVMHRAGFRNLMLGGDFRIAVFVHHVETMHNDIPYRSWINIPRLRLEPDGTVSPVSCRYYGRTDMGRELDLGLVRGWMTAAGKSREVPAAYGISTLADLDDIYQVVMKTLRRDPNALLEPPPA